MATLHLLRRSGFSDNNLLQCVQTLTSDDAVILLDDGCYNIQHPLLNDLILSHQKLFIINEHLTARGLTNIEAIKAISMNNLIHLTFSYNTVMTWQ
jgi:tRNA 2-thiouridine synthesizing protein B